ncbi:MAG: hypothetical protein AAF203_06285, partial [Pseudomonadota bacterium]
MTFRSLISKVCLVGVTALILNQLACSPASFESSDSRVRQSSPGADNITTNGGDGDGGDVVNCAGDNCDRGDNPLRDSVPELTFTPPTVRVTPGDNRCWINSYDDSRKKSGIDGITVWMIVDSSRSFDKERLAVAHAVTNGFLTVVENRVPVTISVITSHAPSEAYTLKDGSKTYTSSAPSVNPNIFHVVNSEPLSITIEPGDDAATLRSKEQKLLSQLDARIKESPMSYAKNDQGQIDWVREDGTIKSFDYAPANRQTGPHSGSDELGIKNFMDAIQAAQAGNVQAQVPDNNAWVFLFLSDENDACVPFTKATKNSTYPSKDGKHFFSHPYDEEEIFNNFCEGVSVTRAYEKALKYAGDRPVAAGALVYTGQGSIPAGTQHDEGLGYKELVANFGRAGMIDIGSSLSVDTIAKKLVDFLAEITAEAVRFHDKFPIYDLDGSDKARRISLSEVEVIDASKEDGHERFNLQVYVDSDGD